MMYSPNLVVTAMTPSGDTIKMVDAPALQNWGNTVASEVSTLENNLVYKITELEKRMTEVESFTRWVAKHHQEVVDEYVVTTKAKERIGV